MRELLIQTEERVKETILLCLKKKWLQNQTITLWNLIHMHSILFSEWCCSNIQVSTNSYERHVGYMSYYEIWAYRVTQKNSRVASFWCSCYWFIPTETVAKLDNESLLFLDSDTSGNLGCWRNPIALVFVNTNKTSAYFMASP